MSRTLAAMIALWLTGAAQAAPPHVISDVAPVHSLVAAVMEGVGTPALIVPPGTSPHDHAMRPSGAKALQEADVLFRVGGNLTPWLEGAITRLAPQAEVVTLLDAPGTHRLALRESALFETDDHDHGHDHEAEGIDPHAWLDPANAAVWLTAIAADLAQRDPENAALYRANAEAAQTTIAQVADVVRTRLAPLHDRPFIVFHDAFQYFEIAFHIPATGAIALSDARRPGPARIKALRDRVAETGTVCVLAEPQFNRGLVDTVLEGTPARLGVSDPLGTSLTPGPDLYGALLLDIADTLVDCLAN